MKKMPSLFKRLLPYIAIALFIVSCGPQKCDCDKPVFNAPGFPAKLDSVYDDVAKKVRPYEIGEAVFYTLKIDASEINELLADSVFSEIDLSLASNSLNNMTMFKLDAYPLDAKRSVVKVRKPVDESGGLNIAIIATILPKTFGDEPVKLGNYILTRQTLEDLTTDKEGKTIKYTHLQITPMHGSLVYKTTAQNGDSAATNGRLPDGCCGNPHPPAPAGRCDCSGK